MPRTAAPSEPFDVLVIGRSCVDYVYAVDAFPAEDRKVAVTEHLVEGGGQGSTASCCIARLGGRVRYVGALGDDEGGAYCRRRLEEFGVRTDLLRVVPGGRTPTAAIVVSSGGKRTIFYEPSSLPNLDFDDGLAALVAAAPVILLDPQVTYLSSALSAAARGLVVYDCERQRQGLDAMMAVADYFIPSSDFFIMGDMAATGDGLFDAARSFRERIAGELIVTMGAGGATWFADDYVISAAPPRVRVKDTTGSGDNFHAAFALGLSLGLEREELLSFAVAVATLSCREYGGRLGIPDREEAVAAAKLVALRRLPYGGRS